MKFVTEADNQHAQWLLEIGAGSTMDDNEMIQVPQFMVCANLNGFINRIYLGIGNSRAQDDQYFLDCIILCPRNDQVHDINEAILQQFNPTAEVHMLRSVDFVSEEDGMHHAYPAEFLQQLNAGVMNIEWDYNYYQPWSDNEWLVDEMLAMLDKDIIM